MLGASQVHSRLVVRESSGFSEYEVTWLFDVRAMGSSLLSSRHQHFVLVWYSLGI